MKSRLIPHRHVGSGSVGSRRLRHPGLPALAALVLLILAAGTTRAGEGTIPRFDLGLEEGVQTVAPLTFSIVGSESPVLDDRNLPYGAALAYDLANAETPNPASFYNASAVKVGSNYYIWAHQGWPEAGCEDTPDPRDQSGDNVVIYKSPHPDVIWPASGNNSTAQGFYPAGCASPTCGGTIQRSELLASLGTDYKTNNVCPTKNHTGMGGLARIGTSSSYVVFFDNNDDDLPQIDPETGEAIWLPGRDLTCGSSCADGTDAKTNCPACSGGPQYDAGDPLYEDGSPLCGNRFNDDAYFDHWALWRPLFAITDGTSFDGVERVAFNGRGIDRVFVDPVPFTIPGNNSAVGFLVTSARAGWCENFRDPRLHYGYVTTSGTPQVFLLIGGSYQNVTGQTLQQIPDNIDPGEYPGGANEFLAGTPRINDVEAVSTNGRNAFVAFEYVVRNGNVGKCGTFGIGWGGPRGASSTDTPVHTELRYRVFNIDGTSWDGWASDDALNLGSKLTNQRLWQVQPFSRDGSVGGSFPDVLCEAAAARLYFTRDTQCTGGFFKDDIVHSQLLGNIAWDSGFRESQASTAPIVVYPQDFGVAYPNVNVPPDVVFTNTNGVGPFGSMTDRADRKWTIRNAAVPSSPGGSYSCAHGFQEEKLKRIIVDVTGAAPGITYDVFVDYKVDSTTANGIDGFLAQMGGGPIYEFSENVAGPDNQYTTVEVDESTMEEIRRSKLATLAADGSGKIGNISIDNEFTSGTPRFVESHFCGFYIERH